MKLYLLTETSEECDEFDSMIFGLFSTKKKAKKLKEKLDKNFKQHNESMRARIVELEVDKVTESYDFIINN